LLGVSAPGVRVPGGTQLALPLDGDAPGLREMTPWERLVADYGSTKVTLREHPLELMRAGLGDGFMSSADLERLRSGTRVRVAGQSEPRRAWSTEEDANDLRAVLPAGHSFGRRG